MFGVALHQETLRLNVDCEEDTVFLFCKCAVPLVHTGDPISGAVHRAADLTLTREACPLCTTGVHQTLNISASERAEQKKIHLFFFSGQTCQQSLRTTFIGKSIWLLSDSSSQRCSEPEVCVIIGQGQRKHGCSVCAYRPALISATFPTRVLCQVQEHRNAPSKFWVEHFKYSSTRDVATQIFLCDLKSCLEILDYCGD